MANPSSNAGWGGPQSKPLTIMLAVVVAITIWSAIDPFDYATWFFELFIGAGGIVALVLLRKRFPMSSLLLAVAAIHYVVLAIGAKYTYAEEPIFSWLRDAFDLSRNHFDRVGHFMQGVTPALVLREVLQRRTKIGRGVWLGFCALTTAMAFSALYEILEWLWVAAFYPDVGPEWLGMQGDPFDAQADMLMATLGGLLSTVILARWHDVSIDDLLRRLKG
jgi:putative membrane protein